MVRSENKSFFLGCWLFLTLASTITAFLFSYQNLNYLHYLTLFPSEKPGSYLTDIGVTWNPQPIIGVHYFGDFQSIIGESTYFDTKFNFNTVNLTDSPFTYLLGMILSYLGQAFGLPAAYFSLLVLTLVCIYLKTFSYLKDHAQTFWLFTLSISSIGFIFAVDRGNFWLVAGLLVYLGSFSRWTKKSDFVFLLIAIAIKPTLITLVALLMLCKKDFRKLVATCFSFLLIQITSLIFLFSTINVQTILLQLCSYLFNLFDAYGARSNIFLSYPSPPNHLGIRASITLILKNSSLSNSGILLQIIDVLIFVLLVLVSLGLLRVSLSENPNYVTIIIGSAVLITYFLGGNGYALITIIPAITIIMTEDFNEKSTTESRSRIELLTLALCSCPFFIPFAFKLGNPNLMIFIIPILASILVLRDLRNLQSRKVPIKKN